MQKRGEKVSCGGTVMPGREGTDARGREPGCPGSGGGGAARGAGPSRPTRDTGSSGTAAAGTAAPPTT
jgi:hypothetical protein